MLALTQTPHEYRPVDIQLPRNRRPAEFQQVSKYGEVPVLVDRGQAYVQSDAILLHLAQRTMKFYGRDAVDHDQVREWLFWEARSEERRVGKECRSHWQPYQQEKTDTIIADDG